MRKGIMTNQRDYNILHQLNFGPTMVSEIFHKFFYKDKKHEKTRWRVMLRRLAKMESASLIKIIENHRSPERILILTRMGAELVCNVFSLEIKNAWTHAGKDQDYYHDITMAEIARNFIFNCPVQMKVDLEFEFFLRKEQQRKKGNIKGLGYPDFRVYLYRENNSDEKEMIYDVERDCSTISLHAYEKKVSSSHYPLIVVTDTIQRANWLFRNAVKLQSRRRVFIVHKKKLPRNIYSPIPCWSPPKPDEIILKIGEIL